MRRFLHQFLTGLLLLLTGCATDSTDGWRRELAIQTSQLGYRNWIVIAEASFPAHSRSGIRQVNSYQPIPEVLQEVLQTLEETEHVRPRIYLPLEQSAVENDFAPGIDTLREQIGAILVGRETISLEQNSLMDLIQDARRSFDVLVIRTTTTLPYSSIFIELEPGYWDGESEQRLRGHMERRRQREIAQP